MKKYQYQHGFSEKNDKMFDQKKRQQKANKTLSVLSDYLGDLTSLSLLDNGCSTGIMTKLYSKKFDKVTAIDIDKKAIEYANANSSSKNITYYVRDGMQTEFKDKSFDVIMCSHIYEHVPDSAKLMEEIYRILKTGGVCYFAAGNRLKIMEEHYKLPFLSIIPKPLAHIYIRLFREEKNYYENHLSLWGLKKLTSKFEIIDYTKKIINNPEKYSATEMIPPGSLKQKIASTVCDIAHWTCPTYIWLLKK